MFSRGRSSLYAVMKMTEISVVGKAVVVEVGGQLAEAWKGRRGRACCEAMTKMEKSASSTKPSPLGSLPAGLAVAEFQFGVAGGPKFRVAEKTSAGSIPAGPNVSMVTRRPRKPNCRRSPAAMVGASS